MLKKIFLISIFLQSSILIFGYNPPTITVNVIGDFTEYENNIIEVNILEDDESLNIAVKKALETQDTIELTLIELGIETSSITPMGHHSYSENEKYIVRKSIQIAIPEDFDVNGLYEAVIDAGAEGYSDYRSHLPIDKKTEDIASPKSLDEAVIFAKKRAIKIAKAFDAEVGGIVSIKELNYGPGLSESIAFEITYKLLY